MKRIVLFLAVAFALAAVPAAYADDSSGQGHGARILRLQHRVETFFDHCGTTSAGASHRCLDVAHRAVTRLQALDAKVQAALHDHPKLQPLDELLQKDIGRFQAWLGS